MTEEKLNMQNLEQGMYLITRVLDTLEVSKAKQVILLPIIKEVIQDYAEYRKVVAIYRRMYADYEAGYADGYRVGQRSWDKYHSLPKLLENLNLEK